MSLNSLLLWHKFSIQTNQYAPIDVDGSIVRNDGWLTINENLSCHFQATVTSSREGRDDTINTYSIEELQSYYTVFHSHDDILFNTEQRFLVHVNPKTSITFKSNGLVDLDTHDKEDIRIFEFLGAREPVAKRNPTDTLFELYIKQIFRQEL